MSDCKQNSGWFNRWLRWGALLWIVVVGAMTLRLPRLDERPMHADEAVQIARVRDLWQQGRFIYDPREYHGPTLPYATLPSLWISRPASFAETSAVTYRIVPVVFGAGLILLLWLLADALGRPAALVAAVLLAVSPAMVFYSRYYIHETLLVAFTLAAVAAGWRYLCSGRLWWCLTTGACVGLMQATKETCVISYGAMLVGWGWAKWWGCWLDGRPGDRVSAQRAFAIPFWHWALALVVALLVAMLLLSSLLANPRGPLDGLLTYRIWWARAEGGSPHVHPWYWYLHRLGWWQIDDGPLWSESLILLLAAAGLIVGLLPRGASRIGVQPVWLRWLSGYTMSLIVAYSLIPYKTPWCLLQLLLGLILLAAVGAVGIVRVMPAKILKAGAASLLLLGIGQLSYQAYQASYPFAADPRNPYVYAATRPDIERLARDVQALAAASSSSTPFRLEVLWHDAYYWPLPWYLRQFGPIARRAHLGEGTLPTVIVASAQLNPQLTRQLSHTHQMPSFYEIRRNVFAVLWVRKDLWQGHLGRLGRL